MKFDGHGVTSPRLFRVPNSVPVVPAVQPSFGTPLGRLNLTLEVAGVAALPAGTFAAGDRSVSLWDTRPAIEVLLVNPTINLPPGMAVDGVVAAAWRVGPTAGSNSVTLKCVWAHDAIRSAGGPSSGQNLDAQTWADGHTRVTVGLPDFETATTYRRDGFEVAVASIRGRTGHFVCAWGPDSQDDPSTWFAVDCTTAQLIQANV